MTPKLRVVPAEPTEEILLAYDEATPVVGPPEILTDEYCAKVKARRRRLFIELWPRLISAAPPLDADAVREMVTDEIVSAGTKAGLDYFDTNPLGNNETYQRQHARAVITAALLALLAPEKE